MLKKLSLALWLTATAMTAQTVVEVNGKKVDERDLYPLLQEITRGQYASLPKEQKIRANQMAVNKAIVTLLIQQEAKRAKIDQTQAYKKAFSEYIKNVVEPTLLYQVWMDTNIKKIQVTDSEAKKFFEENKDRFNRPKEVHTHHILVKTEDEAKSVINDINKAQNGVEKFMQLTQKMMNNQEFGASDLGFFGADSRMAEPFKKAAMQMKVGSISKTPVKTQFGYHVLYVQEKRGGEKRSYKELAENVKKTLQAKKFQENLKDVVEKLRKKAKIEFK